MTREQRPNLGPAYPPQELGSYALLADGERGALVGPRGEICWLCAPRWHDDAVFAALVGGRGLYAVTPAEPFVPGGAYEEGSLIWRSRWVTRTGIVECRDALAFPGQTGRLVLLRRIVALDGPARVHVVLHPLPAYGQEPMREVRLGPAGQWQARLGQLALRWSGAGDARLTDGSSHGDQFTLDLVLPTGQRRDLVLELGTGLPQTPTVHPARAWAATERAWAWAVPGLRDTIAAREARQSYAVLRGLTGAEGGMVAAATTSLPDAGRLGARRTVRASAVRLLRRQARHQRLHLSPAHRAPPRGQRRPRHPGEVAGRQHPSVFLAAVPPAPPPAAGARPSTSRKSPPAPSSTQPTIPGASNMPSARPPSRPSWQTSWPPRSWTTTSPAPASTPSRPTPRLPRTEPVTSGSPPTAGAGTTTARTATSMTTQQLTRP
ncbi:hypothetical protein SAMN05216511_7179 [Streptomyces sp. KS_16]|nr:hypothetical protein BX261_0048 [Streptomyces sp. 2321.6]SDR59655.1 hypothetical protein SAMN05216511_7179 [Streptomyces sp. KS_16]SEB67144.1 hypothetical protein SAMN05428940_0048 [Streptomyces sp. 2133.1]SNC59430.1 hypothetical protein SAMN06272741_0051 [Streptomyces sp. 2114.4]